MNKDTIKGEWKQLSGKIKAKWGELTDDDLKQSEGNTEHLLGKLQENMASQKTRPSSILKTWGSNAQY